MNDEIVDTGYNEGHHFRGLHFVAINPFTGIIVYQEVFDTNRICEDLDEFLSRSDIPDGHIISIACKDDCMTCLSKTAIKWIEK